MSWFTTKLKLYIEVIVDTLYNRYEQKYQFKSSYFSIKPNTMPVYSFQYFT